jgi:CRP/FNR family transcriptional regulator
MQLQVKSVEEYIDNWFSQFEPSLKLLLAKEATIRVFQPGDMLMDAGQYFKSTMLVVDGYVKLYREGEDGNEFFMYMIGPGEGCALSMICALKNERSELKATSMDETVVIQIPLELMDRLMLEHRSWYYFVLETYRKRFEDMLELIDHVIFKAMDERLEFYLRQKAEKLNTNILQITHQEIANDLNSSREVISRLIKKMEQKGMVRSERNYMLLHFVNQK